MVGERRDRREGRGGVGGDLVWDHVHLQYPAAVVAVEKHENPAAVVAVEKP